MKNQKLIRIVLACALLSQLNHASEVFFLISKKTNFDYFMSWVFAFAVETSIFIFTIYSKKKVAVFFGIISWGINLLSYWFTFGFTQNFVAMNLISLIIPITIYFYSELINEEKPIKIGRPNGAKNKIITDKDQIELF